MNQHGTFMNLVKVFILIGVYLLYNVVHQNKSATCIHIPTPSWASLPPAPVPPLYVTTELWAELPVLHSSFPLAIYFTHGSVHRSIPTSQFTPLPLLHQSVSTCPFSTFVSLFLLCKIKSPIPFFYIPHTCINIQYFFLSDLLHSMTDSRSIHISTNVTQFCHFYGWVIFPCIYVPPLPYPFICNCTSGLLSCPG